MSDGYGSRRARVAQMMGDGDVLVLAATPELHAGDAELRYVVDSDLFYLTGYTEPGAVLVLAADGQFTMFVRPRDPERELWTGRRGGVEAAGETFGADTALPLTDLPDALSRLLSAARRIHARYPGARDDVATALRTALEGARASRPRTGIGPHTLIDHGLLLDELRLHKDENEVALLRQAAEVTVAAFREAAACIAAGAGEWEVEAALAAGFRRRRSSGEAFPAIVGGGTNATVLHYTSNNDVLQDGDLALLDAGARREMYCADITRTYAVGAVSPERLVAHDVVKAAHAAAVHACRAGSTLEAVDTAARAVLVQGMIELGLIDGPLDTALAGSAHRRYFPHRTSHWLGLDVHDVGSYTVDGKARELVAGMVFTVEPGLYIPADDERAPAALRGVGIRLEDDVLITTDGADVLTGALPLDVDPAAAYA